MYCQSQKKMVIYLCSKINMAHSYSGLVRWPLTPVTWVRVPYVSPVLVRQLVLLFLFVLYIWHLRRERCVKKLACSKFFSTRRDSNTKVLRRESHMCHQLSARLICLTFFNRFVIRAYLGQNNVFYIFALVKSLLCVKIFLWEIFYGNNNCGICWSWQKLCRQKI